MTSGAKASDLRGEVGAEIGVGDDVDLDSRALEDYHSIRGGSRRDAADCEGRPDMLVFGLAEDADARDDAALVAARGEGFQQQAIGFVAASVGRVVERVLGQEDLAADDADQRG